MILPEYREVTSVGDWKIPTIGDFWAEMTTLSLFHQNFVTFY